MLADNDVGCRAPNPAFSPTRVSGHSQAAEKVPKEAAWFPQNRNTEPLRKLVAIGVRGKPELFRADLTVLRKKSSWMLVIAVVVAVLFVLARSCRYNR